MASWHALHTELLRATTRRYFHSDFQTLRTRHDALAPFAEPIALLDRLRAPAQDDGPARNAILADLVAAAQARDVFAGTATEILLLALWPGLDAIHRRLARHFRDAPDELVARLMERITRGIHALDPDRVFWIAATLLMNTERDLRRELARHRSEVARHAPLPDEIAPPHVHSWLGLPSGADAESATRMIAGQLRALIGGDADLVVAVAICGERQCEAADRLGLGAEATRKRYQRALRRLRVTFSDAL